MNKISNSTLWKPAACVLVVLLQWAVWSHLGLEMSPAPNEPPEKAMPDLGLVPTAPAYSDQEELGHDETTVGAREPRSLQSADLCWQLRDWPLPGCSLG